MAIYIVLLGPPGAGKGTQAEIIADFLGIAHVSSGNLFRENISKQTELGKRAKEYTDKGELVPDNLTIAMVEDRLLKPDCVKGALLDGFPRTPSQAESLDNFLVQRKESINAVPFIDVPLDELVDRLSDRLTCEKEGHVFHRTFKPPQVEGVCDFDGSRLIQREDDKPETVKKRIEVYLQQTEPLIDYYRKQGKICTIDGTKTITEVSDEIIESIENRDRHKNDSLVQ